MSAVTLTLLPDDPAAAQQIVGLQNVIDRLRADVKAKARALEIATMERDIWREAYLKLDGRVAQLDQVRREVIELRGDQAVRS